MITYRLKLFINTSGLPVEIVSEFKLWREIVDIEGEHNWVHKAMLSGNRHAIVKEEMFAYSQPNGGQIVAKLEKYKYASVNAAQQPALCR